MPATITRNYLEMGVPGKGGENLHSFISFLPAAGSGLTTYVHITAYSTKVYFEATHQWLNRETAAHIAKYMPPFEGEDVRQRDGDESQCGSIPVGPDRKNTFLL